MKDRITSFPRIIHGKGIIYLDTKRIQSTCKNNNLPCKLGEYKDTPRDDEDIAESRARENRVKNHCRELLRLNHLDDMTDEEINNLDLVCCCFGGEGGNHPEVLIDDVWHLYTISQRTGKSHIWVPIWVVPKIFFDGKEIGDIIHIRFPAGMAWESYDTDDPTAITNYMFDMDFEYGGEK